MGIGSRPKVQDVSVQDATNPVLFAPILQDLGTTTLSAEATINTTTAVLTAGHGVVVGNYLAVEGRYVGRVLNVATNTITLGTPFGYTFPAGTAVTRCTADMNVNASSTPVIFGLRPSSTRIFDIEGFTLSILSTVAMDDSKFGGLAALAIPITVRVKKSSTWYNNVFSAQTNGGLKLYGTVAYADKAPANYYGMNFKFSFKDVYGVVARLYGDQAQEIQIVLNSDFSGLYEFRGAFQGHVVDDSLEDGIDKIELTSTTWVPITLAGQSATVGTLSNTPVWITSSEDGNPSVDTAIPLSRNVERYTPLELEPDLATTRFYARCINAGESSSIIVDIIG